MPRASSAFSGLTRSSKNFDRSTTGQSATRTYVPLSVMRENKDFRRVKESLEGAQKNSYNFYKSNSTSSNSSSDPGTPPGNDSKSIKVNEKFSVPDVLPLYERKTVAPTPSSTRSQTPLTESAGEKKVRFMESEVLEFSSSRPVSSSSTYSNIVKNSSKYSFTSENAQDIYGLAGHNPRICNCPCHFFPKYYQNTAVQTHSSLSTKPDVQPQQIVRPIIIQSEPSTSSRLYLVPSFYGVSNMTLSSKLVTVIVRMLLSQTGLTLIVMLWWLIGALVFSTLERSIEETQIKNMGYERDNIVIDLATELRQVKPYEKIWIEKIEEYMEKMEDATIKSVKAGYHSGIRTWTFANSFLYAFSLTTMIGPGGLVVQSPLSKIFSVIYAFFGIPITFLLLLNFAQTLHEGLVWLWNRRRRKRQITEVRTLVNDPINIETVNSNGYVPSDSRGNDITTVENAVSKNVQNHIGSSKNSRIDRATSSNQDIREISSNHVSFENSNASRDVILKASSSTSTALLPTQNNDRSYQGNPSYEIVQNPNISLDDYNTLVTNNSIPWLILLILPILYFIISTITLTFSQNLDFPSVFYIMGSIILFTDHGGIEGRPIFYSEYSGFLFSIFLIIGFLSVLTVIVGIWSKVSSFLGETGKTLYVVKPLTIYR